MKTKKSSFHGFLHFSLSSMHGVVGVPVLPNSIPKTVQFHRESCFNDEVELCQTENGWRYKPSLKYNHFHRQLDYRVNYRGGSISSHLPQMSTIVENHFCNVFLGITRDEL